MKTTDSVMREFDEKYGVSKDNDLITTTRYSFRAFISHSLAEARRDVVVEIKRLKTKIPHTSDEFDWGYRKAKQDVLDLLTGDNPERKV